jgi:ectoine hydroxylase-related dioxygenase (phytanoyl-CoA dioxygenase family)
MANIEPATPTASGALFEGDARRSLDDGGYCVIEGVLSGGELEALRERLDEQAAGEQAARAAGETAGAVAMSRSSRDLGDPDQLVPDFLRQGLIIDSSETDFPQGGTGDQHVASLLNKGAVFRELLRHPVAKAMLSEVLGSPYLLSYYAANIVRTPKIDQPLHSDVHYLPPELFTLCLQLNVFWLLDDYTPDNGATRVVPGSHRMPNTDLVRVDRSDAVQVEAPAGSLFAFDARLLHAGAPNTTGQSRRVIFAFYKSYFMRQNENYALSVAPEVLKIADAELRDLLGLRVHSILGVVDGHSGVEAVKVGATGDANADGISGFFVDRPDSCPGPLTANGARLPPTT